MIFVKLNFELAVFQTNRTGDQQTFLEGLKTECRNVYFWLINIEFSKDSVIVGGQLVDPALLSTIEDDLIIDIE